VLNINQSYKKFLEKEEQRDVGKCCVIISTVNTTAKIIKFSPMSLFLPTVKLFDFCPLNIAIIKRKVW
jgi:hypothetical protein